MVAEQADHADRGMPAVLHLLEPETVSVGGAQLLSRMLGIRMAQNGVRQEHPDTVDGLEAASGAGIVADAGPAGLDGDEYGVGPDGIGARRRPEDAGTRGAQAEQLDAELPGISEEERIGDPPVAGQPSELGGKRQVCGSRANRTFLAILSALA